MNNPIAKKTEDLPILEPFEIFPVNQDPIIFKEIRDTQNTISPLVTAEIVYLLGSAYLDIRMTVFVPVDIDQKDLIKIYLDPNPETPCDLKLDLVYKSLDLNPEKYIAWYLSYRHTLPATSPIARENEEEEIVVTILTTLKNSIQDDANPKTSRGTVTQVIQS